MNGDGGTETLLLDLILNVKYTRYGYSVDFDMYVCLPVSLLGNNNNNFCWQPREF